MSSSYTVPQVLVFQEFQLVPSEITEPLRAHISGPNAQLHRYSDADEKPLIKVGEYDPLAETCYLWPGRSAGGEVDQSYVKVFIDNALLRYFQDVVGGGDTIRPVANTRNEIRAATLGFVTNPDNDAFERSAAFNDRDVKVGDVAWVRGVVDDEEYAMFTTVKAIKYEQTTPVVGAASPDASNEDNATADASIQQIAGPHNCVVATADGSDYSGLVDGNVTEVYTILVTRSSTGGDLTTARLRVTSASGNDNNAEVDPAASGNPTDIGSRGLKVTFGDTGSSCSSAASAFDVSTNDLVAGQKWQVSVTQDFEAVKAKSGGTYSGTEDDVIIVEVTRGGTWSQLPQITVTTAKGLDFSGPTTVPDHNTAVAIGTKGATILFYGGGDESSVSSLSSGNPVVTGSESLDGVAGLRKGDKFYINATAAKNGRASTLVLANDLAEELQGTTTDLDLNLYIKSNIQVAENRVEAAPTVNYTMEETQICINSGITAYDPSWTDSGEEQPLEVESGDVYIEYREWLSALCDAVEAISDVADLDDIPGQLSVDNPLKWGVYKALTNSNGTIVRYTGVCNPDDIDSWQDVLSRVKGRDDLYNLVPLTFRRDIKNLYLAHADAESSAEAGNWKACFFSFQARSAKAIVSQSTAADEEVVLATLADDPDASGVQYTILSVPLGNADFITNNVQPGDIVRYLFSTDGFGDVSYTEFVIDSVISEDSVRLQAPGHTAPINVAQKIEVWHTLTKSEIADEIAEDAATYSNRRACTVWPDVIGEAGTSQEGYFVAAALAGLVSAVVPHQGLTNVELKGFDDVSRTSDFFNTDQLNEMASRGVWIVTADRDGTIITRHAVTTDNTDVNRREEMIRRNFDSISYVYLRRLKPFIGRTNVTPSNLRRLRQEIDTTTAFLKTNGTTEELGSQLIDGKIRSLERHPLLADRVVVVMDMILPAPLNNIELHLVV